MSDEIDDAPLQPRPPADNSPATLATGVVLGSAEESDALAPINVSLTWDSRVPFRVTMITQYPFSQRIVEWEFARELLIFGGGRGDVRISWDDEQTVVDLDSLQGCMQIVLPRERIKRFTAQIELAMPLGKEPSLALASDEDWENELALLNGSAPC